MEEKRKEKNQRCGKLLLTSFKGRRGQGGVGGGGHELELGIY